MRRLAASLVATGLGLALLAAERPAYLCAQAGAAPGPVEIVLDASGGMAGRMDGSEKMAAARAFLNSLEDGLAAEAGGGTPALRVFGGRDCNATERLVPSGGAPEAFRAALAAVRPSGIAPLALALERAAADTAPIYVLVTGGLGSCGGDACRVWGEVVARGAEGNRRARLHVVALDPEAAELEELRCLSRAGSGSFTVLADADSATVKGTRLSRILRNRGLLEVRLAAGPEPFTAPIRVLRPLTSEVVLEYSGRAPRELPAGMYTVVIETMPAIVIERVMVLPGETALLARSDYGRLRVEARDPADAPVPARVSIRRAGRGALRFASSAEPITLRAGTYDVVVDVGDSLVVRRGVVVAGGQTTIVNVGGLGTLVVAAPGFDDPPPTRAFLYGEGGVDTLSIGEPIAIAAGHYRLVAQTVPVYVTEEVDVEPGRETRIALPDLGILGVDVFGPDGLLSDVRVDVREPMTQEVYGALVSGERRLTMPGTYALDLATAPPRTIEPVGVAPGRAEVVVRRGLGRVVVRAAPPGTAPLRLELLPTGGGRALAEATGPQPALTAWPGTYRARVWQGSRVVWDGRVTVAPSKSVPIDWARP